VIAYNYYKSDAAVTRVKADTNDLCSCTDMCG